MSQNRERERNKRTNKLKLPLGCLMDFSIRVTTEWSPLGRCHLGFCLGEQCCWSQPLHLRQLQTLLHFRNETIIKKCCSSALEFQPWWRKEKWEDNGKYQLWQFQALHCSRLQPEPDDQSLISPSKGKSAEKHGFTGYDLGTLWPRVREKGFFQC